MKRLSIAILFAAISAAALAQADSPAQIAIGLRAQESRSVANARQAAHYTENRQRCETALRVAKLCGKYAGKFYCDEKGFREIPAGATARPVILDPASAYKMERCALDAAKSSP